MSFLNLVAVCLAMAIEVPDTLINNLIVGSIVIFAGFLVFMIAWSLLVRLANNTLTRSRLYFIPEILRGLTPSFATLSFLVSLYFAVLFTDKGLFEHPLFKIWGILVIFVIVNILAKILLTSIDLYYKKVKTREIAPLYRSLPIVKSAVGIILYTLALLLSIQVLSVEAGSVVSALAVLAVLFFFVIFYDQIRSVAAGFQLTGYYMEEGDLIELGAQKGFVEGIYGRSTLLRTLDGEKIAIPNYLFFKKPLRIHKTDANEIGLWVQMKTRNTEKTKDRISSLATKTALSIKEIPSEYKPKVFLISVQDGCHTFLINVKLSAGSDTRKIVDALGRELAKEFKDRLVGLRMA